MNKEYKTLLQQVHECLTERKTIRKQVAELKPVETPVIVSVNTTSECGTELYIVYINQTHGPNNLKSHTPYLPVAAVHEGGKWYRAMPLPPEVVALMPDVPMQVCKQHELRTIARFGITGIVMGEHERTGYDDTQTRLRARRKRFMQEKELENKIRRAQL